MDTCFDNIEVNHEWSFTDVRSTEQWTHGYHRYPAKFLPNVVKKLIEDSDTAAEKVRRKIELRSRKKYVPLPKSFK